MCNSCVEPPCCGQQCWQTAFCCLRQRRKRSMLHSLNRGGMAGFTLCYWRDSCAFSCVYKKVMHIHWSKCVRAFVNLWVQYVAQRHPGSVLKLSRQPTFKVLVHKQDLNQKPSSSHLSLLTELLEKVFTCLSKPGHRIFTLSAFCKSCIFGDNYKPNVENNDTQTGDHCFTSKN